ISTRTRSGCTGRCAMHRYRRHPMAKRNVRVRILQRQSHHRGEEVKAALAILLALTASAGAAQAQVIPAEYRGEWCTDGGPPYYRPIAADPCERGGWGWIRITAKTYEADGGEMRCRVARVTTMKMLAPHPVDYVMKFKCD